jgi:hypothetical protein
VKVILDVKDPTPIAYLDVYEDGDRWERIRGCDECPEEWRAKCCKGCMAYVPAVGCMMHGTKTKPFVCVVVPAPSTCRRNCVLEFICTTGSKEGWARRVADSGDVCVAP